MVIIKGFPEYTIDENGRVYDTVNKKFLKPTLVAGGLQYRLRNGQRAISGLPKVSARYGHRLVADAFIGLKQGETVGFKDGNMANIKLSNLYVKKYESYVSKEKPHKPKSKSSINYECDTSWMGTGYQI